MPTRLAKPFKRSDGRWCCKVRMPNGSIRYAYGASAAEARERAHLILTESRTLAAWCQEYLDLGTWRPSTTATYQRCLDAWCAASVDGTRLGDIPLVLLTPLQLRQILAAWRQQGLAPATIHQRLRALHTCLEEAVRLQLLTENPTSRVSPPREERQYRSIWSREQAHAYLDACLAALEGKLPAPSAHHADTLALALLTGLRIGEVLGLRPCDITSTHLTVRQTVTWVNGSAYIGPPKTRTSLRSIPLPQLAKQLIQRRLQETRHANQLLFTTRTGEPVRRDNLTHLHRALCHAASVPHCRIHDLRRVHAALLLAAGTPITTTQALLGHATARLTLEVYAYVTNPPSVHPIDAAFGD